MYQLPNHVFFVFWVAILGENLVSYMGKQSSSSQHRPATPDEGTTTHHAAPLEGRLLDHKFLSIVLCLIPALCIIAALMLNNMLLICCYILTKCMGWYLSFALLQIYRSFAVMRMLYARFLIRSQLQQLFFIVRRMLYARLHLISFLF